MALIKVIPTIFTHNKFSQCTENNDRQIAHLLTLFGFLGCFIVTSIIFPGPLRFLSDSRRARFTAPGPS